MNTIPHLEWVTANARITVGPVGGELPTLMANTERDVTVSPALLRLLRRADIQPPPAGKVISITSINNKLATAGLSADERLEIKNGLVRLGLVELGKPVNV